jgi:hypothetical protein
LAIGSTHFIASSKSTPNFAKSGKARPNPGQENQRKRLGFPWILLAEMSLFNGLQRPPSAKSLYPPPLSAVGLRPRARFIRRPGQLPRILIIAKQFRGQWMVDRIFIIPARLKSIPSGRVML